MNRLIAAVLSAAVTLTLGACASAPRSTTQVPLSQARRDGRSSGDGEVVGRWLLDEMFAPGGTAAGASEARSRLLKTSASSQGLYATVGAALYDETHGEPKRASSGFVAALGQTK